MEISQYKSDELWHEGQKPEIQEHVNLSKSTTAKTGSTVSRLHLPKKGDDLKMLPSENGCYRIISGGSNLLITDLRDLGDVISMRDYDDSIVSLRSGVYKVGCSARIQSFIRQANADGYGDIEELVSVPGMLGGLICMNASIPSSNCCISDHLVSVEVFDGETIKTIDKDECKFAYRKSRFQNGLEIILSATFKLPNQDGEISRARIEARKAKVKRTQDYTSPNFGTVYKTKSNIIMRLVRFLGVSVGGSHFSKKTNNWLCCGGTFTDSIRAMQRVEAIHRLLRIECKREVVVWE